MLKRLVATENDYPTTPLRLVLGIIFFAHGARRKCWVGLADMGFSRTMGFFTGMMHIPAPFAFLADHAEFFGSID